MNIRFFIPGKRKAHLDNLFNEYLKRLSPYAKVSLTYIKEEPPKSDSNKDIQAALDKEAKSILKQLKQDEYVILIDIHAKELSTAEFTEKLAAISLTESEIAFIIGSSNGLSDELRRRADLSISLSKLTFTHYHALLLLLEQVYRSFLIRANKPYDK